MVFIDIILTNCKERKKKKERRKFFGFFLNKMNENCNWIRILSFTVVNFNDSARSKKENKGFKESLAIYCEVSGASTQKKGVGQMVSWSVYFSHHLHHSFPYNKTYNRTCAIMQNDYQKAMSFRAKRRRVVEDSVRKISST